MTKLHILTAVTSAVVIMGTTSCDVSPEEKDTSKIPLSNLTWNDVGKIYGNNSDATEIFKKEKWKDFKGKKVRWSGKVGEIETTFGVLSMSIIMNYSNTVSLGGMSYSSSELLVSSPEVEVILKKSEKEKGLKYKVGDRIEFEGILDDWSDFQSHVEISNGVIIENKE